MTEKITVSCLREDLAVCPGCGSRNIVGREKEYCHCGQCGRGIEIRITNRIAEPEERTGKNGDYEQLSLF